MKRRKTAALYDPDRHTMFFLAELLGKAGCDSVCLDRLSALHTENEPFFESESGSSIDLQSVDFCILGVDLPCVRKTDVDTFQRIADRTRLVLMVTNPGKQTGRYNSSHLPADAVILIKPFPIRELYSALDIFPGLDHFPAYYI